MPLHLQQHKSYHPYNKDNIERVRRDEEIARAAEEGKEHQSLLAESEARIEALKRLKGRHNSGDGDRLRAAEREIDGQKGALTSFDKREREKIGAQAGPSRLTSSNDTLVDKSGHINFWVGQESARKRQHSNGEEKSVGKRRGNSEYEAEKSAEKQRWEDQTTMYLGKPAKELHPWYQNKDLQSGEERKRSHEQKLEAA
jgi:hypothetical protein